MAEQDICRPEAMASGLYKAIRKDYDRAVARLGMAQNRSPPATQATINKNVKLLDDAKAALHAAIVAYSINPELREMLAENNRTSSDAVALLKTAAEVQTDNHSEVMAILRQLVPTTSTSSSAAAPEAMDLDLPECLFCMDPTSTGIKMSCCTRPGSDKIVCLTCFMGYASSNLESVCPACRGTPDFTGSLAMIKAGLHPDLLDALKPQKSKEFIVNFACLAALDDDGYNGSWRENYYLRLSCHSSSGVDRKNPAWAVLVFGDFFRAMELKVPVCKLIIQGDAIDTFVRSKCDGKWPEYEAIIRLTFVGSRFPAIYQFEGFERVYGGEPICKFSMNPTSHLEPEEDEDDAVPDVNRDRELIQVPLANINTWTHVRRWTVKSILEKLDYGHRHLPCEILIKMKTQSWGMTILIQILDNGIGPQLVLSTGAVQRIVDIGMIENIVTDPLIVPCTPVFVYGYYAGAPMPVPCVMKVDFAYDAPGIGTPYRAEMERGCTFFGYSARNFLDEHAIFSTKEGQIAQVKKQYIRALNFVKAGVQ